MNENEKELLARVERVEQIVSQVLSLLKAGLPPQRISATVREAPREWKSGNGKTYTCDARQGANKYPFLKVKVREQANIRELATGERFTFEGEIESFPTQSGKTGFAVFANDIRDESGNKFPPPQDESGIETIPAFDDAGESDIPEPEPFEPPF